jgi:adenylate kinase
VKIVICGLSGSGKNYLIDRLTKKFSQKLLHINGSGTLNKLAESIFSKPLKDTDESEKKHLRIAFCEKIKKSHANTQSIIVDGHYSFLNKGKYETVFTDKDSDVYDIFFYLDTPAGKIIENANKIAVKKDISFMSEKEINEWKDFEILSLKKICLNLQKELIVLDNNIEDTLDYFEELLFKKREVILDSAKIAEDTLLKYRSIIDNHNKIILLDCDRTLSVNDTTYDFCDFAGIEKKMLKGIFLGERYSMYQFFRAAKLYAQKEDSIYETASDYAASKAILNEPLIDDINSHIGEYLTIGVTSGILATWRKIFFQHGFSPNILIGGNNLSKDKILVTATVKYYLAKLLRENGKRLIAIGDSIADIAMLEEADKGFIIAQEKLSPGVERYLSAKKTKIFQLEYSRFKYSGIPVQQEIYI